MNQIAYLKDKKNSTGRLSAVSSSQRNQSSHTQLKRKGVSLHKKAPQIQDICATKSVPGRYLMGWGKVPSLDNHNKMQLINKGIVSFDCGQEHLIFVTQKYQAFAVGSNQFGQLGTKQNQACRDIISPVFEKFKVKKVFCTHYNTFFITYDHQLYGCGINNRGQLGLGYNQEKVNTPSIIESLSQATFQDDSLERKTTRNRISSVYYNQAKKSDCQELSYRAGSKLLEAGQRVRDIRGGPFHTAVLTSKGRILYAGNLYKSDSLLNDEYTNEFIVLNTSSLGKALSLRSYLTGICIQTLENKLYLLGNFGQHIFDEPYLIGNMAVLSYGVNQNGIYLTDTLGDLIFFDTSHSVLKAQKILSKEAIRQIHCGMDYLLAITKQKNILGLGNNNEQQLCTTKVRNTKELIPLLVNIKAEQNIDFACSNNFVLCLVNKPISCEASEDFNDLSKCKDLQRQNKVLKQLLCNKSKKNAKIQTDKQGKFQFSKSLNPRTFDNSMEIPFEQLSLGRQISEGGYGIIYEAAWRQTTVAVKLFKIDQENDNSIRDFISECHAMEVLRHPNIVMFLGACTKSPNFAIVLEYCPGGTLWSLLQNKNTELSWSERRNLALDTAKGMNYLHERPTPILHRDLKSLNLLLDQNRRIKLADFGWTKGLQNYMTGKIGTYQWMAPEVIAASQYTEKADVYSFGIILWEIASREAPYRNIPGPQVAQQVLSRQLRPTIPRQTPEVFSELIRSCWQKQQSLRPSFSTIIGKLEVMRFN